MREITYGGRRKRRKLIIGILAGILILAALIVFGLFRVQEVVIIGNENFTAKQIQQAVMQDGLCKNSLYLLWKFQDKERTAEALPFLSAIEVELKNPFKVQIRVYEKPQVGYLQAQGKYVYFDKDGLVVETSEKIHEGVPLLTGLSVSKVELYETMEFTEEGMLDTVLTLTRGLNQEQLIPDEIRFSTTDEIILIFGKVKALLGKSDNLEDKIAALASIYPKVEENTGNLHMQNYSLAAQTVTFRQGEEEEELALAGAEGGEGGEEAGGENTQEAGEEGADQAGQAANTPETQALGGRTYQESDGTFSTDADGNTIYTDAAGNTTPNCSQYNYTDENGGIIMDGYGYIDPYTGAYIN
ncbi:MAG: cell division protein FtsQ/DivIB [Candidatus Limivivens sp.]|nr:cell division protein FtsQ/DivIB [Candidatus Limivivens sp.]